AGAAGDAARRLGARGAGGPLEPGAGGQAGDARRCRGPGTPRRVRRRDREPPGGRKSGRPAGATARAAGEGTGMIKAGEISEILKRQLAGYEAEVDLQEVGRFIEVGDGIARIYGLEKAMSGELVQFTSEVVGMVLNLEQGQDGKVLLGEEQLIH